MVAASGLHGSVAAQTESQLQTMQSSSGGRVREREGLGVHFTIGRPKLSIGRPIPTVFFTGKTKRSTEYGRVFRCKFGPCKPAGQCSILAGQL